MTKEEAIKTIENRDSIMDYCESAELGEALDMAINALSAEPCEDCISRAEAIRIASGYCHWTNIPDELAKLPSVTPKQKMGRWIEHNHYGIKHIECSSCSAWVLSAYLVRKSYCPNCGAKMSENPTGSNCTDCVLDGTDACSRGAGRAVDGRVCEDFVGESGD